MKERTPMKRSSASDALTGGVLAMLVFIASWPALDIAGLVLSPDYLLPLALIPAIMTLFGWITCCALHDIRRELRRLPRHADQPLPSTKEDPQ